MINANRKKRGNAIYIPLTGKYTIYICEKNRFMIYQTDIADYKAGIILKNPGFERRMIVPARVSDAYGLINSFEGTKLSKDSFEFKAKAKHEVRGYTAEDVVSKFSVLPDQPRVCNEVIRNIDNNTVAGITAGPGIKVVTLHMPEDGPKWIDISGIRTSDSGLMTLPELQSEYGLKLQYCPFDTISFLWDKDSIPVPAFWQKAAGITDEDPVRVIDVNRSHKNRYIVAKTNDMCDFCGKEEDSLWHPARKVTLCPDCAEEEKRKAASE